jgi:DNA-binding response OmpR family regulator
MSSFERCIVLVVDDEPTVLKTVTYVLERHGYIVIPAPDGLTALCACLERGGPVHLAVRDITMPGMSGLDLFDCLLEFHPKIEGLFMAEYPAEHLRKHASVLETAHFIAKPFLPRDLVQRVNGILGNEEVCNSP